MDSRGDPSAAAQHTLHLQKLAERNRLKRLKNAKSSEQQAQEELEKGFSTHFRGANKSPADLKAHSVHGKDVTAIKINSAGKSPQVARESMRPIKGLVRGRAASASAAAGDELASDGGLGPMKAFPKERSLSRYTEDNEDTVVDESPHNPSAAPAEAAIDAGLLNNVAALSPGQQAVLLKMLLAQQQGMTQQQSSNIQTGETSPLPQEAAGSSQRNRVDASADGGSSPSRTRSQKRSLDALEMSPALRVRPIRNASPITVNPSDISEAQERSQRLPAQPSPARPGSAATEAGERPLWLPRAKSPTTVYGSCATEPRSRPTSSTRPSPYRQPDFDPTGAPATPVVQQRSSSPASPSGSSSARRSSSPASPSGSSSARRRRRSNRGAVQSESSPGDVHLDSLLSSSRREPRGEEQLRQSLAALSHADRGNLGRIGVADSRSEVSRELFANDSSVTAEASAAASSDRGSRANLLGGMGAATVKRKVEQTNASIGTAVSSIQNVIEKLHQDSLATEPSGSLANPNEDEADLTRESSRLSILRNTVKRKIDVTNEKVGHAVADLQDVLAGLQPISGEGFQRVVSREILPQSSPEGEASRYLASIPTLPEGKELVLEVLSTWGDQHYVGLAGIDIFDASGAILVPCNDSSRPSIKPARSRAGIVSIEADPSDINVLPEYHSDPRVSANLLDGVNFTRDDMHVWLAPVGYCGQESTYDGTKCVAKISIDFKSTIALSMIRIFNYNKSRTHAARGARMCRIIFDGVVIFHGEIRQSPGQLSSPDLASETILFTTDDETMLEIAQHDEARGYYLQDSTQGWVKKLKERHNARRPLTADGDDAEAARVPSRGLVKEHSMKHIRNFHLSEPRPATQANMSVLQTLPGTCDSATRSEPSVADQTAAATEHVLDDETEQLLRDLQALGVDGVSSREQSDIAAVPQTDFDASSVLPENYKTAESVRCAAVRVDIEAAWDPQADFVGLMGVQLLLATGPYYPPASNVTVQAGGDVYPDERRPVANLVNGVNDCTDDSNSWLAPLIPHNAPKLLFRLHRPEDVVGLRIWNYNKATPAESILRGVRSALISVVDENGASWAQGRAIFRQGPGVDCVAFGQVILLSDVRSGLHCGPQVSTAHMSIRGANGTVPKYIAPPVAQDYETPLLPCGLLWRLEILENWNDGYYVGLDGIEFYDHNGKRVIPAQIGGSVSAFPHSLNDVQVTEDATKDPRTPDKLFFSAKNPREHPGGADHLPWLAPLAQCMTEEERYRALAVHMHHHVALPHQHNMATSVDINRVFVMFPVPIGLSAVRIWNYSKTPARGARHFRLSCDGRLVYMGSLVSADQEATSGGQRQGQTVLLSAHPRVVNSGRANVSYCGTTDQDVLCVNERKVMVRSKAMYSSTPNVASDGINSDLSRRPVTAAYRAT